MPKGDGRGGDRPGAGRPPTKLVIYLPKDYYSWLVEFARDCGKPPDAVAANLVMAHLESRKSPIPPQHKIDSN